VVAQVQKNSPVVLYGGLAAFIAMALVAFAFFFVTAIGLFDDLSMLPASISFDKGAFYLLGVGLALSVLTFVIIYEPVMGNILTPKIGGLCTKLTIAGVLIMFILPHLVHYGVQSFLTSRGYEVCGCASHQWLHSRTIVYVRNQDVCDRLMLEKRRM